MNKLIIIAAVGKNLELGYKNNLIWRIKDDMKFFKKQTINHHVLMGSNTFLSLPNLLPNRTHIVLTSKPKFLYPKEVIVVNSINEFNKLKESIVDDVYVIGGGNVYSEFINDADEIILTEIDAECKEADVYFPKFKYEDYDKLIIGESKDNVPSYKHVKYTKKNR